MTKIKALLVLLAISSCIALIGLQQQGKLGGNARIEGNAEMNPPSNSVGPSGNIQAADGNGGFQDTGCQANVGGVTINCNTFVNSPTVTFHSKTCPIFPDSNYWNTNVSAYPYDQWNTYYNGMWPNVSLAFTNATWVGGTATVTVASTSTLTNGGQYPISGAISANCVGGGDCGFNSHATTLGSNDAFPIITITGGTTFTYSLASNPGAWSSGGIIYTKTPVLFHTVPEMYLNLADNSTTTLDQTNSIWDVGGQNSDAGPYPWTTNFLMSVYDNTVGGGYVQPFVTVATSYPSADRHVISINVDQCKLYETYFLQNNAPPWHNTNGAIWDLKSNDLRTMHKMFWYGNDSTGLTSADVMGAPIWSGVLQYAELFSGLPIKHAIRVGLPGGQGFFSNPGPIGGTPIVPYPSGFVWPGTHVGANAIPLGSRWVLDASFDGATCHFRDCAGLAWPGYMQRFITALKTYGVIFVDTGQSFVGMSSDAVSNWGAVDDPTSPTYVFTGWLHGIMWQNGHVVDNTIHTVNTLSGALR